jgi:hypothetical protein
VFKTSNDHTDDQLDLLQRHYQKRSFDPLEAQQLLRDHYLDKYFKDTYIEWGTRQFIEKVQTRSATNAKILLKKQKKTGNAMGLSGNNALIERILEKALE